MHSTVLLLQLDVRARVNDDERREHRIVDPLPLSLFLPLSSSPSNLQAARYGKARREGGVRATVPNDQEVEREPSGAVRNHHAQ